MIYGLKDTLTYVYSCGKILTVLGKTSNPNYSVYFSLLFLTSNLTVHGILLKLVILNFSTIPSGFLLGNKVPNKKVFSSTANTLELIIEVIYYPLDATTIYSSKIDSKFSVIIPGIQDSPMY